MGSAMARRFAEAGFPTALWNRDRSKAEAVASVTGSRVTDTAASAAADADFVVSSLADDQALIDVYLGEEGIASGIRQGAMAIDTSTVDPTTILRIGEALDDSGVSFVDCPVSGSVSTVDAGMLAIMAGGDSKAIDRARPLLGAISKQVIRVGDLGAGAACKLAVNSLLHGLNIALSEALVLAERAGVDRNIAYEVFSSGAAGAPFLEYKRAAYQSPEDTPVAFSLDLVAKDLELITQLGERVGAPMAQAQRGLEIVNAALDSGMGDEDLSAVAVYLRGISS